MVVGFAFKVSAFPFQFWAPDTYEGSPVPVAAFLAVASSVAGFAGLLQLMFVAFADQYEFWVPIFAFLSIATMTVGNLVALQQTQVVRLLAYSGIAQSGYILLTFALVTDDAATNRTAFSAAVAYILIYGIMNIGAFAVTVAVSRRHPTLRIADFAGLRETAPLIAIGMTVFMISLAGVPPTGGFWGKLLIFQAAIERGGTLGPCARDRDARELGRERLLLPGRAEGDVPARRRRPIAAAGACPRDRRGRGGHGRDRVDLRAPGRDHPARGALHARRRRALISAPSRRAGNRRARRIEPPMGRSIANDHEE